MLSEKDGRIEIQASELPEGTVVEVIILAQHERDTTAEKGAAPQETLSQATQPYDETAYLLSTEANRKQLMDALQAAENEKDLVSFTAKEWDRPTSMPERS